MRRRRNSRISELQEEVDRLEDLLDINQRELLAIKSRQNAFHSAHPNVMRYLNAPSPTLWKTIKHLNVNADPDFPLSLEQAVDQQDVVIKGKTQSNLLNTWEWQQDEDVVLSAWKFSPSGEEYPIVDAVERALNYFLGTEREHSLLVESLRLLDQLEKTEDELTRQKILQRRREFKLIIGGKKNNPFKYWR